VNDVYKFNLETNSWSTVPSENLRPRSVFGVCTLGTKIVLFGGEVTPSDAGHAGAGNFENDVVALDTDSLEWSSIPSESDLKPPQRGWHRITATGEKSFLLFGGLCGNDENPVRLDDTWECKLEF